MNARAESIGMEMARMKSAGLDAQHTQRFRVARGMYFFDSYWLVFLLRVRRTHNPYFVQLGRVGSLEISKHLEAP